VLIYREVKWRDLPQLILESVVMTSIVLLLIGFSVDMPTEKPISSRTIEVITTDSRISCGRSRHLTSRYDLYRSAADWLFGRHVVGDDQCRYSLHDKRCANGIGIGHRPRHADRKANQQQNDRGHHHRLQNQLRQIAPFKSNGAICRS
jgi:hypothetical protein